MKATRVTLPSVTEPQEWRPIPGRDGYEVSSLGLVRSWVGPGGVGSRHSRVEPHLLVQNVGGQGYYRVKTGGAEVSHVAHLVALAFFGPRPDAHEVRHLNGVRTDNRVENLAYGTRSENQQDAVRHGTHNMAGKTHCKHGHEFTAENTYYRPTGGRRCRTCQRAVGRVSASKRRRSA